jgi:predicted HicB family RNase H-like nuclease
VLPAATAARLRELRVSGRSGVLSATLAALHAGGWPLPALAEALGISRQAVQARIRQPVPAELRDRAADCAPPPFPRRRQASKGRLRPHLTIKIDHALRAAAHRAAAGEGHSLSQVVETILDRYVRHGIPEPEGKPRRAARRSR